MKYTLISTVNISYTAQYLLYKSYYHRYLFKDLLQTNNLILLVIMIDRDPCTKNIHIHTPPHTALSARAVEYTDGISAEW